MFGRLGNVPRRIGSLTKNGLALVGAGTTLYGIREYKQYKDLKLAVDDDGHDGHDVDNTDNVNGDNNNDKNPTRKKAKKVLVLPFHKMKIVEHKKPTGIFSLVTSSASFNDDDSIDNDDKVQEVELQSLLNVIHEAAIDPDIVALYGTFGNGFRFDCGGYAHIEEIRNAIRVFNESHRRHYDPAISTDTNTKRTISSSNSSNSGNSGNNNSAKKEEQPMQKFSYAFADTFDHPIDSGNKEYFLATAFSNIQMQPRGNLNLFGVSTSNFFLLNALEKYGIIAHVFKHGKYKNAPNTLTEIKYTKSHLENTTSIINTINQSILSSITQSRNLYDKSFTTKIWNDIHDYGTLSASNAQEINLIDFTPRIDPLRELVLLNKHHYDKKDEESKDKKDRKDNKVKKVKKGGKSSKDVENSHDQNEELKRLEYLKKRWTWLASASNEQKFIANEIISFQKYASILQKRAKWKERMYEWNQILNDLCSKSSATEALLSVAFGYKAPYFNIDENEYDEKYKTKTKEKIAIVHITGGINDATSRKVVKSLRQIKQDKDIKAVVFRVDSPGGSVIASETILEECKDMQKPVVCSFGNVAASGGYYVSANADRIFASPTTLTGSIGVFGIKFDATELARSHGVEVDFVSTGSQASAYSIFRPLTKKMKINFERNIEKVYSYFKEIVSQGRNIPLKEVEEIAKGRVWTGEQAREVGLVDEIGGLERAILYAKRKYTTDGFAEVEVWPKQLSLQDRILKLSQMDIEALVSDSSPTLDTDLNPLQLVLNGRINPSTLLTGASLSSGMLLTIDESTAVQLLLKEALEKGRN